MRQATDARVTTVEEEFNPYLAGVYAPVQEEVSAEDLEASDIAAGPVGRVLLPFRVPLGFHALWVREDQLGADV